MAELSQQEMYAKTQELSRALDILLHKSVITSSADYIGERAIGEDDFNVWLQCDLKQPLNDLIEKCGYELAGKALRFERDRLVMATQATFTKMYLPPGVSFAKFVEVGSVIARVIESYDPMQSVMVQRADFLLKLSSPL